MKPYLDVHPWSVVESGWNPEDVRRSESIFSIGNGRFGQRANFEEQYSGDSLRGSYVAGVYYPDKTRVGWWKNGYPEYFAKVLNATNWIAIDVEVNGEAVDLARATSIEHFRRELDMKAGLLMREVELTLPSGARIRIESERFCSMARPEVAAIRYRVTALTEGLEVTLSPGLDGDVFNEDSNWDDAFWEVDAVEASAADGTALVVNTTLKTAYTVGTAMVAHHGTDGEAGEHSELRHFGNRVAVSRTARLATGQCAWVEKFIGLESTLHHERSGVALAAEAAAEAAADAGFDALKSEHAAAWAAIWSTGDIEIGGDDAAQQGIRFNIFHLNQTYRGDDERLNIGPKGFTGEKYGGASYWDTEAYCLPFFLATHPVEVPKQLLAYRYAHLDRAIENAEKLGFKGGAALYPMVTMNGEECHNEWEITFEEIHRNGAMSFAIANYVRYTGDRSYLADKGFPVLLGVARFWAQRVNWSEARNAWVMLGVTGPNEYENNVNNNWYTNYLAAWCLRYTADVAEELQAEQPEVWASFTRQYGIDAEHELKDWRAKAEGMHLPKLEGTRVWLQQDGFMDKEQRLVDELDPAERPINQHWSWDRILRSVYIKQADVLQGLYFFEDDFDAATHAENFDFYEPRTVHESSLSPCVHVVLASKLGRPEKAYELYLRTARLDLDDYNAEAYQGLHITSMAGTWLSVVEGFGGFRVRDGVPQFTGQLPAGWSHFRFTIRFRDRLLGVTVTGKGTDVTLLEGATLNVKVDGEVKSLHPAA